MLRGLQLPQGEQQSLNLSGNRLLMGATHQWCLDNKGLARLLASHRTSLHTGLCKVHPLFMPPRAHNLLYKQALAV